MEQPVIEKIFTCLNLQARSPPQAPAARAALMAHAGLRARVSQPPQQMVDEDGVMTLHRTLRAELGIERARAESRTAGRATGDYLLAPCIPQGAQRLLPPRCAGQALLAALTRHAWTFCGSGAFHTQVGQIPKDIGVFGPNPNSPIFALHFLEEFLHIFQQLAQGASKEFIWHIDCDQGPERSVLNQRHPPAGQQDVEYASYVCRNQSPGSLASLAAPRRRPACALTL
jgi:bacteriochlorophyll 4-vinyl reductase